MRKISKTVKKLSELKKKLENMGFTLHGDDPLKLTVCTSEYGYRGAEFSEKLKENGVFCEYADPDYVVMMITPENCELDYDRIYGSLSNIKRRPPIEKTVFHREKTEQAISIRQAMLSRSERIPTSLAVGRILAQPSVSCPPAVMPICCGETVTEDAVKILLYYGINEIYVK